MNVTVTKVYLPETPDATTMSAHGQSDDGATVIFAGDRRPMEVLYDAVMENGEQPVVDVPAYQVLNKVYPQCTKCGTTVQYLNGDWQATMASSDPDVVPEPCEHEVAGAEG